MAFSDVPQMMLLGAGGVAAGLATDLAGSATAAAFPDTESTATLAIRLAARFLVLGAATQLILNNTGELTDGAAIAFSIGMLGTQRGLAFDLAEARSRIMGPRAGLPN